jgi:hypothetical protein
MTEFTPELGLAIYRTDFGEVGKVAATATDRGKTAAEAEKVRQSKDGKRIEAELAKNKALRGVGSVFTGVHDTLVNTLGVPGALGVELAAGTVPLSVVKALGGKILATKVGLGGKILATKVGLGAKALGSKLLTGVTAAGAGTVAAGAAAAGVLAGQVALTASLGGDRTEMGRQYISERSQLLGQDIAAAAIQQGDVNKVIGRAKGDKEIQAATMEALLLKFDQLNATLQGQAAAYAEAMGRKVLKVAMPADPNAPKGN